MGRALSDIEQKWIVELGETIRRTLLCDANETGLPCRTDRLYAVEHMIEYVRLHNYEVTHKEEGE